MIKERILQFTNGGLDIFHLLYTDLPDDTKKKFRSPFRSGDSTPSASLKMYEGVWYLKDFGINEKGMNAIDAYMKERCCDFPEALKQIADIFNIPGENSTVSRSGVRISKRQSVANQQDGMYFETKQFTKRELEFLSPGVTEDVVECLGYESVRYYYRTNQGTDTCYEPSPGYFIFVRTVRELDAEGNVVKTFHKLYQPQARKDKDGKSFKFMYVETGKNPNLTINGLYELKQEYDRNGQKKQKAVIVCGERDAITCKKFGFNPIWFNSESHTITHYEINQILKYASVLYYIPDNDAPGKTAGMKHMREFPTLKIVWLPEDMKKKVSDQHKPCKDLRDWADHTKKTSHFIRLLNTARSYKITYMHNNKLEVSPDNLVFMLEMNGFRKYKDAVSNQYVLVHCDGNRVKEVSSEDLRCFVIDEISSYSQAERDAVMKSTALDKNIRDLKPVDLDFRAATGYSQTFTAQNASFIVTAEGVSEIAEGECNNVWDDKMIKHDIHLLQPMFSFSKEDNPQEYGTPWFPVKFSDTPCKAARHVRNLADIHWEKEEKGDQLTEYEQYEKDKNVQALMYNIGRLLHRHHKSSTVFAPYFFEYNRFDEVELNGGTGKSSLITGMIAKVMAYNVVTIKLTDKKKLESTFVMQRVTPRTDILFFDECFKLFRISDINSFITDGIDVEKKHKDEYFIPIEQSPNIVIASNHDPIDFDPSTCRRGNYCPISHYYHYKSPVSGFSDNRTIASEFGIDLWSSEYSEDDWNMDVNFLMQCLHYYLAVSPQLKAFNTHNRLEATMTAVLERYNENIANDGIGEWARAYFTDSGGNLNREIEKNVLVAEYNQWRRQKGKKEIKLRQFTKDLKAWIATRPDLTLDPEDMITDKSGHRIRHNNLIYHYVQKGEAVIPF